jgi:hypothetical protein
MGSLTGDMTRLRSEISALRGSRESLLKEMARAVKDRKNAVAGMRAGFRKAHAEMARNSRAERVSFFSGLRTTVSAMRKRFADDINGAHQAWFGATPRGGAVIEHEVPKQEEVETRTAEERELPKHEEVEMGAVEEQEVPKHEKVEMGIGEEQEVPKHEEIETVAEEEQKVYGFKEEDILQVFRQHYIRCKNPLRVTAGWDWMFSRSVFALCVGFEREALSFQWEFPDLLSPE